MKTRAGVTSGRASRRGTAAWSGAILALVALATPLSATSALRRQAEQLLAAEPRVLAGRDGWLFLPQELRALLAPRTWGPSAQAPPESDPLPAILDFHAQLKRAGIDLIVAPVPPKLLFHADSLFGGADAADVAELGRELAGLQAELGRQGVAVLDLAPHFTGSGVEGSDPLYCRTDTHWSPRGLEIAARAIAERLGRPAWLASVPRRDLVVERRELEIAGDLTPLLPAPPPREKLVATTVFEAKAGARSPLGSWRESPVLLLGDSHVLVFSAGGDLHARGAGLPDHLALALGFPVDVVGVRGSGATPARVNLMRRGDSLAGKRVVVWVFAGRELLAGAAWKRVPVIR